MRTNPKRRNPVLTLAALTLLVGLPELAFAQQSGLFPNAPIRRGRPPCDQEDSVYKLYRHQYFGYHPTCWRKFPDGWGCPSPEAPDKEKSFREIERKRPTPEPGEAPEEGEEMAPKGDMERPAEKPRQSPFELPAVPEDSKNPFDLNNPAPGGAPAEKPANPPQTSRASRLNSPDLAPPVEQPETGRTSRNGARSRSRSNDDDQPILAMSDEVVPDSENSAESSDENVRPVADVPPATAAPAQAPARRGMISGLLGGNGWTWRRR